MGTNHSSGAERSMCNKFGLSIILYNIRLGYFLWLRRAKESSLATDSICNISTKKRSVSNSPTKED